MSARSKADTGVSGVEEAVASRTAECAQATSRDAFLDGRLLLTQPLDGPRAAIDGVLLGAAVPVMDQSSERVLDAGAGTGIVSLTLASRTRLTRIIGVERQSGLARLARENAAHNAFAPRVEIVAADLTDKLTGLEALGLERESFDHVAANPPYYADGTARPPASASKRDAHMAGADTIGSWMRFLVAVTKPGGTVTVIHRPDQLPLILSAADGRYGGLCIFPLYPRLNEPATRIIVQGTKGSKAPLSIASGLVLHEDSGAYRPDVDAILKGRKPLTIRPLSR